MLAKIQCLVVVSEGLNSVETVRELYLEVNVNKVSEGLNSVETHLIKTIVV